MNSKDRKIGLALGSGGMRGLAHIGVIKALCSSGFEISHIAGSSVGALIGGLYAQSGDIGQVEEIVLGLDRKKLAGLFLDFKIGGGVVEGEKIEKFIDKCLGGVEFGQLKIAFCAVATDVKSGKLVKIKSGKVSKAIMVSGALPVIFNPVDYMGRILIDGGVSMPVPCRVVKQMGAKFVVGVNLYCGRDYLKEKFRMYDLTFRTMAIMLSNLAVFNMKEADYGIVADVGGWGVLDFFMERSEKEEIIRRNEKLAREKISEIKEMMKKEERGFFSDLGRLFRK